LARWMKQAGFAAVHFELWTMGIVSLHTAFRPQQ
jgi:ubiquinone/menaquinone biosynthesis C-methylase UbiE